MLAALYDIHGNLPALEAVLADARGRGVTGWVLGGDYALFGGWPEETVARLRELQDAQWIRGNGERWTAAPDEAPEHVRDAVAASREALGAPLVSELAALPADRSVGGWFVVHGSPRSDVESFLPERAETDGELLDGFRGPRLLFGHTHLPFRRGHEGIELVNPGSVGMPFDGDRRAAYALLHDDGRVEHLRVDYDVERSIERAREQGGWAETTARRLEAARFV